MENNFSKFELTTSLVAIGKKLPVISLPAKKNVPKKISLLNHSGILGLAVMCLTISLLITLIISVQQARNSGLQPELVSRLQLQHLRSSNAAQQITIGNISSFALLRDSRNQMNRYIVARLFPLLMTRCRRAWIRILETGKLRKATSI